MLIKKKVIESRSIDMKRKEKDGYSWILINQSNRILTYKDSYDKMEMIGW